jgi:hypothetical protein
MKVKNTDRQQGMSNKQKILQDHAGKFFSERTIDI